MTRLHMRGFGWRGVVVVAALALVGLYAFLASVAVGHGNTRTDIARANQEAITRQLDDFRERLTRLEDENKALAGQLSAAATQANASVGQLTAAGQKPIIAAPGVVTVPTTPSSTVLPVRVIVPIEPSTSTTAAPETTTTDAPTTTAPTTTEQPPTTNP